MTRDEWAAQLADVIMEIADDAAAEALVRQGGYDGPSGRERKRLRQALIFLLSERPE
jgi:hypothetical protein